MQIFPWNISKKLPMEQIKATKKTFVKNEKYK